MLNLDYLIGNIRKKEAVWQERKHKSYSCLSVLIIEDFRTTVNVRSSEAI